MSTPDSGYVYSANEGLDHRQVSYLIGLFATIGHLLDGHHLIGADIMGLM